MATRGAQAPASDNGLLAGSGSGTPAPPMLAWCLFLGAAQRRVVLSIRCGVPAGIARQRTVLADGGCSRFRTSVGIRRISKRGVLQTHMMYLISAGPWGAARYTAHLGDGFAAPALRRGQGGPTPPPSVPCRV